MTNLGLPGVQHPAQGTPLASRLPATAARYPFGHRRPTPEFLAIALTVGRFVAAVLTPGQVTGSVSVLRFQTRVFFSRPRLFGDGRHVFHLQPAHLLV